VNLLLDTHVVLLAFGDLGRLGPATRAALVDRRTYVAVSSATMWEVEIKRAIGKLRAPADMAERCSARGYDELAVTWAHARRAGRLERHHDDPFDRMLVAQALEEQLTVVTVDQRFAAYDVAVMSAAA
jgi:PIN domain nuclease of toxin-antitoxin system